jgi:hypothetical protein
VSFFTNKVYQTPWPPTLKVLLSTLSVLNERMKMWSAGLLTTFQNIGLNKLFERYKISFWTWQLECLNLAEFSIQTESILNIPCILYTINYGSKMLRLCRKVFSPNRSKKCMKFVIYADNIQIYFLKTKLFVDSRDLPDISEVILTTMIALLVVTK